MCKVCYGEGCVGGLSAFCIAAFAYSMHVDNIKAMLQGGSALNAAASRGFIDLVELLLAHGAKVNTDVSAQLRTVQQPACLLAKHCIQALGPNNVCPLRLQSTFQGLRTHASSECLMHVCRDHQHLPWQHARAP